MLSVVVTGNTGSGKSTLSGFFSELGIDTVCADKINADILKYCRFVSGWTNQIIGYDATVRNCVIDKTHIRSIIFNNPLIKKSIESMLHPLIYENLVLQKNLHQKKPYIILEIPLLFESQEKFDDTDAIILITSKYTDLQRRITNRPGISPDQAKDILNSQLADRNKFAASDAIVINNGNLESLRSSTLELDHYLRTLFQD